MIIQGYIAKYNEEKQLLGIVAPFDKPWILEKQCINEVEIHLTDGRVLSAEQRMKIHALVGDITAYVSGFITDHKKRSRSEKETLRELQVLYLIDSLDSQDRQYNRELIRRQLTTHYCFLTSIDLFSLSEKSKNAVDMTTARDFVDWLVELCVIHGIPCMDTLLKRCEDIGRYLYACVANRRCAICGIRAQIHEVDRVGSGRNRRKIHHMNQRVQPLCAEHHHELDCIGQQTFDRKYHMDCIRLDEYLCDILRWKK